MKISVEIDIAEALRHETPLTIIEVYKAVDRLVDTWDLNCAVMDYALELSDMYRSDHGVDYLVKRDDSEAQDGK